MYVEKENCYANLCIGLIAIVFSVLTLPLKIIFRLVKKLCVKKADAKTNKQEVCK